MLRVAPAALQLTLLAITLAEFPYTSTYMHSTVKPSPNVIVPSLYSVYQLALSTGRMIVPLTTVTVP